MTAPKIRFAPAADDGGFRRAVNLRVEDYFIRTGKSRVAGPSIYLKAAFFAVIMVASYAALLGNAFGAAGSLALAIVCGLAVLFLVINVAHDAAHLALTGNGRIDPAIHRVLFALVGVDGYLWRMRHDGSHHVFPNVNGCDVDIDKNPLLRLSPNHPRTPMQRWQHLYAPFVYMLTLTHSFAVNDFVYLRKRELANMRDIRHAPRDVAILFLAKAFYITVMVLLPLVFVRLPWWQVPAGYFAVCAVQSLAFVFLLVGTHFSSQASYPMPDANGDLRNPWSVHAMLTSVDWLPHSRVAAFFSGGSNAHAAHHLFPRLSHRHYRAISAIIRQTAREYGVRYNETSFLGAIALHFRHLRQMARDDGAPFSLALSSA